MDIIGLDIGTAHARAATMRSGAAALVPGDGGTDALPTAVSLDGNRVHVGARALDRLVSHPGATVRSVKHTLGRERLVLDGKAITPERLLSALIRELRDRAEQQFGRQPSAAVVCVSIWLEHSQRQALVAAARRLGLEVLGCITDASAVALNVTEVSRDPRRVIVVDVGAGGSSVSVLTVMPTSVRLEFARGVAGSAGDAVDAALAQRACRQIEEQLGQLPSEAGLLEILRQGCERAKRDLSSAREAAVALPWRAGTGPPSERPTVRLERSVLPAVLGPLLAALEASCVEVLARARLGPGQADALYLTGGMTRLPLVQQRIEEFVGLEASRGIHPAGAAALGAALHGAALCGARKVQVDEPGDPVSPPPPSKPQASPSARGAARRAEPKDSAASDGRPSSISPKPERVEPAAASSSQPQAVTPSERSTPGESEPESRPAIALGPERPRRVAPEPSASSSASQATPSVAMPLAEPPIDERRGEGGTPSADASPKKVIRLPPRQRAARPTGGGAPPSAPIPQLEAGTVRNPTSAPEILELPLARPLGAGHLEPIALAVLMARVLARMGTTGTLTLSRGDEEVKLPVTDGSARVNDGDRAAIRKAAMWPEASYSFERGPPDTASRSEASLVQLAAEGVRAACRELPAEELLAAFAERRELAPVLLSDRTRRLRRLGLDAREKRFVESQLDGTASLQTVVDRGGVGRATALQVLVLLTVFDVVAFEEVVVRDGEGLSEQLAARAARMQRGNHFEALGVHWSALAQRIQAAYDGLCSRLAPGGEWDEANPEACRAMRERADQAYAVLSEPQARLAHRTEQYPDHDTEALDDLLRRRGQALELKGAKQELRETQSKRSELAAMRTAQAQQRASLQPNPRSLAPKGRTGSPQKRPAAATRKGPTEDGRS